MKPIVIQSYYKIRREVSSIEQQDIEEERYLYLYDDKVMSEHHEFPVEQVMDMSYRKVGKQGGLLYLHTSQGVFSFSVKHAPQQFMNTFKSLTGKK